MKVLSFRKLALAWSGLAGVAVVGAAALQASYEQPAPAVAAIPPAVQPLPAAPQPPPAAAVPFENRSLLAMLPPPDVRPRPAPRRAEPLPVPPVPPARVARAEPHRAAPVRVYAAEPADMAEPAYPGWEWNRRLRYPGQYAMQRAYPFAAQPAYYGWQADY